VQINSLNNVKAYFLRAKSFSDATTDLVYAQVYPKTNYSFVYPYKAYLLFVATSNGSSTFDMRVWYGQQPKIIETPANNTDDIKNEPNGLSDKDIYLIAILVPILSIIFAIGLWIFLRKMKKTRVKKQNKI
jgi:ATP-dependent Zn protease